MAIEARIPQARLIENGFIDVLHYFRDKYERNDEPIHECSNCKLKYKHKHIYEYKDGSLINICFNCNKFINNLKTLNPNFKKR